MKYTKDQPDESGYYYHINGHGTEEIVKLEMTFGTWYVHKFNGSETHIDNDKGMFGDRIMMPSEEY